MAAKPPFMSVAPRPYNLPSVVAPSNGFSAPSSVSFPFDFQLTALAWESCGRALTGFLRERFKGTRPIAEGRQLQELLLANGIYVGVMGLDSLEPAADAAGASQAADAVEAVDAGR